MFRRFLRYFKEHRQLVQEVTREFEQVKSLPIHLAIEQVEELILRGGRHIETAGPTSPEPEQLYILNEITRRFFLHWSRVYIPGYDVHLCTSYLEQHCLIPDADMIGESKSDNYKIASTRKDGKIILTSTAPEWDEFPSVYHFVLLLLR